MKSSKHQKTRRGAALVGALAICGNALAFNPGGGNDPSTAYASAGQFGTTQTNTASCTIFRPTSGSGHPIIIWGNGTGASPSTYAAGLRHLASHGFIVAAANTSNAGTGAAMLACIGPASSQPGADPSRIGTSGHSQGGGGSIMAGRDSRVDATAPMQPYVLGLGHQTSSQSQQVAPMLLMSGSADTIATPGANQQPVFGRANVPVFWATRSGASHFEPVGDFGDFRGLATAWFRYLLRGDQTARNLFTGPCTMCSASGWTIQRKGTLP
jgi:hypothetical protein